MYMHVDKVSSLANFHSHHDCTVNKRQDLEEHIFAHICMLTKYLRSPIFIQILNVLDLHFQDQIFESNTLASSS